MFSELQVYIINIVSLPRSFLWITIHEIKILFKNHCQINFKTTEMALVLTVISAKRKKVDFRCAITTKPI